jgi:hypothetical protein
MLLSTKLKKGDSIIFSELSSYFRSPFDLVNDLEMYRSLYIKLVLIDFADVISSDS